ncbi:hypothetical protein [Gymnodinialimonas sp.]
MPDALPHADLVAPVFEISKTEFLLKLRTGLRIHYRKGHGATFEKPDTVSDAEVTLFFNGSVFGAIAWMNGFVPLHASAVVDDGAVHAFTGASGTGKSTLAAALGARGFPLMADDVLVLDLRDPDVVTCLPGFKRLKLWQDALDLTCAEVDGKVRDQLSKFYARPPGGTAPIPLPLAKLYFLKDRSDAPTVTPIQGIQRFTRARSAFYRLGFLDAISDKRDLYGITQRLSQSVPMAIFDRPRGEAVFDDVASHIASVIRNGDGW